MTAPPPKLGWHLGAEAGKIEGEIADWQSDNRVERLWKGDHTLWTKEPAAEITDRLGWLRLPETSRPLVADLEELAAAIRKDRIEDVLLFGMGGSSLAPEVFQRVLGNRKGFSPLTVVDTTHPDTVASIARGIDPASTFCFVSSKSGGTLETMSLFRFFWSLVEGNFDRPGQRFAAITDPGSSLEALGRERSFGAVLQAQSDVGGRYSALTPFGLAPAAAIGADLEGLLSSARKMSEACAKGVANPGVELGVALGCLARSGRDKLTLLTSESLAAFPDWLEQLIAESTGKDGVGIVPVAGEPLAEPGHYGSDRVFVLVTLEGDETGDLDRLISSLGELGHPTLRVHLESALDLGGEMYRWEFATAVASSVLGVHPFNQENVQLAKTLAQQAMAGEGESSAVVVPEVSIDDSDLGAKLGGWIESAGPGDYFGLQAYLPSDRPILRRLQALQGRLHQRTGRAATAGFGPRFLHSTGQLHKGGANNGVFLQIVNEPETDLRVPETDFSFGKLIAAQAEGDARALLETGRRLLRLRLGKKPLEDLELLDQAL